MRGAVGSLFDWQAVYTRLLEHSTAPEVGRPAIESGRAFIYTLDPNVNRALYVSTQGKILSVERLTRSSRLKTLRENM